MPCFRLVLCLERVCGAVIRDVYMTLGGGGSKLVYPSYSAIQLGEA